MKRTLLLGAAILMLTGSANAADPTTLWKQVGPWRISVDASQGNGCFMLSSYPDGTAMRFGIHPQSKVTYIMLANTKWASLEVGKDIALQLSWDDGKRENAPARVMQFPNGLKYLWMQLKWTEDSRSKRLWDRMARAQMMRFFYRGKSITHMRLNGTFKAVGEMFKCQRAMVASGKINPDPFSSGGPKVKAADPFSDRGI